MQKRKRSRKRRSKINSLVVVSDTHCGCRFGLCPPRVQLDSGGTYEHSELQAKVWNMWRHFWDVWVPEQVDLNDFAVVFNGDIVDGVHHNSTTQISHNMRDQANIACEVMAPIAELCGGNLYWIRGTPAHVGQSACEEERIAKEVGAIKSKSGLHARYVLWKQFGDDKVANFMHHVGTTSRPASEANAIHAELAHLLSSAGRWRHRIPDVVVRSHRHACIETRIPVDGGVSIAMTTAAWQLKTPFAYKVAGARNALPQIGGSIITYVDGEIRVKHKIWPIIRDVDDVEA